MARYAPYQILVLLEGNDPNHRFPAPDAIKWEGGNTAMLFQVPYKDLDHDPVLGFGGHPVTQGFIEQFTDDAVRDGIDPFDPAFNAPCDRVAMFITRKGQVMEEQGNVKLLDLFDWKNDAFSDKSAAVH